MWLSVASPHPNHEKKETRMNAESRAVMDEIVELNYTALKEFAVKVKGKLTRTGNPNEADFVDAIHGAAVDLAREPEDEPT